MGEVGEPESKKPGFLDQSPLSAPWTIAVVLMLIFFFFVIVKIGLSG